MGSSIKRTKDAAAHQPTKTEMEESVKIDAAPEALAWAVTRGGADRRHEKTPQENQLPQHWDSSGIQGIQMVHYAFGIGPNDALSLENELLNWHALREVDVSYFIGDSALQRFLGTQMGHIEKQFIDRSSVEIGVPNHNLSDK